MTIVKINAGQRGFSLSCPNWRLTEGLSEVRFKEYLLCYQDRSALPNPKSVDFVVNGKDT